MTRLRSSSAAVVWFADRRRHRARRRRARRRARPSAGLDRRGLELTPATPRSTAAASTPRRPTSAALADQVEALGTQARGALAALNGADPAAGRSRHRRGRPARVRDRRADRSCASDLAAVPYVGTPAAGLRVSDAVVARHAALVAALDATDGLDAAWDAPDDRRGRRHEMSQSWPSTIAGRRRGRPRRRAKYADAMKVIDQAEGAARRGADAARPAERHRGRHGPRRVAQAQRDLRRRPAEAVQGDLQGRARSPGDARSGQGGGRRRAQLPPDTRGLVDHHGRDRAGRDERRGHHHRGGAGHAGRRPRSRHGADAARATTPASRRPLTGRRVATLAPEPALTDAPTPRRSAAPSGGPHPCNFVSSPISHGTCPPTSSSSRSPASRPSTARSASSIGGPAASSSRSSRSASSRQALRDRAGAGGETCGGRVLAVGLGDPATLDRETVVRVAASAERRLGGRTVKRLAVWLTPLADALEGGASGRRRAGRPRRRRGKLRPAARSTATKVDSAPPDPRRADPHRPGRRCRRPDRGRRAGHHHRPRARTSRGRSRTAPPTTSARRSSPTRPAPSPSSTACGSTSSTPERATELGHGHVHGRRPRQRQPAADDRHALRRGRASATRSAATSPSSARASASTRAASASSRPTGWKR